MAHEISFGQYLFHLNAIPGCRFRQMMLERSRGCFLLAAIVGCVIFFKNKKPSKLQFKFFYTGNEDYLSVFWGIVMTGVSLR